MAWHRSAECRQHGVVHRVSPVPGPGREWGTVRVDMERSGAQGRAQYRAWDGTQGTAKKTDLKPSWGCRVHRRPGCWAWQAAALGPQCREMGAHQQCSPYAAQQHLGV